MRRIWTEHSEKPMWIECAQIKEQTVQIHLYASRYRRAILAARWSATQLHPK